MGRVNSVDRFGNRDKYEEDIEQNLANRQTQTAEWVLAKRGKATVAETEVFVAEPGEELVLV